MYEPVTSVDWQMNPDTDDLLPDSRQLEEGMIVLIGDHISRMTVPNSDGNFSSKHESRRWLENNRWCRVTEIGQPFPDHNPDIFSFVGVYEDGTKMSRKYNLSYPWYVKKGCLGLPLIMTADEWYDANHPTNAVNTFADSESPQSKRPYAVVSVNPVFRAQVFYMMFGDETGEDWCNTMCSWHKEDGDIVNYQWLDTTIVDWGLQGVMFTIDVEFDEDMSSKALRKKFKKLLRNMIGEANFKLLSAGVVALESASN